MGIRMRKDYITAEERKGTQNQGTLLEDKVFIGLAVIMIGYIVVLMIRGYLA